MARELFRIAANGQSLTQAVLLTACDKRVLGAVFSAFQGLWVIK